MTQQGPNPVDLYEAAVQYMHGIIAGVKAEQFGDPTPCDQWNVQELILHNVKVSQAIHNMLTDGEHVNVFEVSDQLSPEDALAAFEASTGQLLQAAGVRANLEKRVDRYGRQLTGRELLMAPFSDLLIHKWDLAKATEQDSTLDSAMAEASYGFFLPRIETMRDSGNFGRGRSMPITASSQDKLLALTGREP